jgi:transposase InsO family protein
MNPEWLAIQSFQRSQDLLTAINTLSIHTKLKLSGHSDRERAESVAQARGTLASFLKDLGQIVEQMEQTKDGPLLGVDPRLRQLAGSFVRAKREKQRFHSRLFRGQFSDVVDLLTSTDKTHQQELIECLSELRALIEEHVQTDTARILEDF